MVRLFGPLVRGALAGAWPLVLAAAIAPARAQGPAEAAALGDRRMAEGSTESAIEAYRAGLVGRPADPELLWKTARALSNLADETPGEAGDEARMEEAV
jgi:hypothetical protein